MTRNIPADTLSEEPCTFAHDKDISFAVTLASFVALFLIATATIGMILRHKVYMAPKPIYN
jgi:hypothetical protein